VCAPASPRPGAGPLSLTIPPPADTHAALLPRLVELAVEANAHASLHAVLSRSAVVTGLVRAGRVHAVVAKYELTSGRVQVLAYESGDCVSEASGVEGDEGGASE
jgi:hypothetical protein